ncbi:DUF1579 family protein [Bradyrhizobium elkanii]|nr:DUF1579 family protein [Bradyrhizobium elkanii]
MAASPFHTALLEFLGNWDVTQRIWLGPAAPQVHKGHCKCEPSLDGTATIMTTEVPASKNKGVSIITYNSTASRYELAWLDSSGGQGLCVMHGRPDGRPSRADIQKEFGGSANQEREWYTVQTTSCIPEPIKSAVQEAGMRLVENKISKDEWVLEFFVLHSGAPDQLVMQNIFTRAH